MDSYTVADTTNNSNNNNSVYLSPTELDSMRATLYTTEHQLATISTTVNTQMPGLTNDLQQLQGDVYQLKETMTFIKKQFTDITERLEELEQRGLKNDI